MNSLRRKSINKDGQESGALGRRCHLIVCDGQRVVRKTAGSEIERAALAYEADFLEIGFSYAPRFINFDAAEGKLDMEYIEGYSLHQLPQPFEKLSSLVSSLHRSGFVFCDLRPENVRIDLDGELWLLDWESVGHIGTEIATLPRRPYSSGFTHPDLIWGRGVLRPEIDLLSLERIKSQGFLHG